MKFIAFDESSLFIRFFRSYNYSRENYPRLWRISDFFFSFSFFLNSRSKKQFNQRKYELIENRRSNVQRINLFSFLSFLSSPFSIFFFFFFFPPLQISLRFSNFLSPRGTWNLVAVKRLGKDGRKRRPGIPRCIVATSFFHVGPLACSFLSGTG